MTKVLLELENVRITFNGNYYTNEYASVNEDGIKKWTPKTFHLTLQKALLSIIDNVLPKEQETINEYLARLNAIKYEIIEKLEEASVKEE